MNVMLTLWYLTIDRFPMVMAARTTKTALVVGLFYGGLQDLAGAGRGRRLGYIDFVRRQFTGDATDDSRPVKTTS